MASLKILYLPISVFAATFETCFLNPRIYLHIVVLSFSIGILFDEVLKAKFGAIARSSQVHQIRGKAWEVLPRGSTWTLDIWDVHPIFLGQTFLAVFDIFGSRVTDSVM